MTLYAASNDAGLYGPFFNRLRSYWNPNYPAYWTNPSSQVTVTSDQPQTTTVQIPTTAQPQLKTAWLAPRESYIAYMGLACIVFWCCGSVLFGLAAFILAAIANSEYVNTPEAARRLGRLSLFMSIAGVVVSMIIAAIVLSVYFSVCTYRVNGQCYRYQRSVGTSCCATGQTFFNNYCYGSPGGSTANPSSCAYTIYNGVYTCYNSLSAQGGCCNTGEVYYSNYCYS